MVSFKRGSTVLLVNQAQILPNRVKYIHVRTLGTTLLNMYSRWVTLPWLCVYFV